MLPDVLRTLRLVLRPWSLADAADVFAYAADEEWGRYLPTPHPYGEVDAHRFVADQVALDRRVHAAFAIEHERRAIGGVDLRLFEEGRIAEIDFAVARALWGRGLATEAVTGVVDSAFGCWPGLTRIRSMIDARNAASARVLEKVGMTREGLLRSNSFARGEAVDEAWYGILRSEWHGS
jgi:[ribosomal protein S5]-alanine N-acetyltransferase